MDMNLFFGWAKEQQDLNKKMTNDINPDLQFSIGQNGTVNFGAANQNDFMRDNLHFTESGTPNKSQDVISRIMSGE